MKPVVWNSCCILVHMRETCLPVDNFLFSMSSFPQVSAGDNSHVNEKSSWLTQIGIILWRSLQDVERELLALSVWAAFRFVYNSTVRWRNSTDLALALHDFSFIKVSVKHTVCATVHLNRSNINLTRLDFFSKLQYSNGNGANPVFFCLSALVLKARGQKNMFFKNGVSTFWCLLFIEVCVYVYVCKVLCDDVMKADIDAVIADLLQLYDMEAKCIWTTHLQDHHLSVLPLDCAVQSWMCVMVHIVV